MRVVLLAIGDELLDGRTTDTNSVWIASRLLELGLFVVRKVVAPDAREELRDALGYVCARGDIVIVTGGLGPTEDDRTREVLAEFAGVPLEHDEEAWQEIQSFFRVRAREVPEANRRQALMPRGAERLRNRAGTAPGIEMRMPGEVRLFALPGVPSEVRAMFDSELAPRLAASGEPVVQRTLAFYGVSESELGGHLADLATDGQDVRVGITASWGLIRVTARASGERAEARVEETLAEVRRRCGRWFLGTGRGELASFLVARLTELGQRIAFAESCTAGLCVATLAEVPGVSQVLEQSFVTYSNAAKQELLGVDPGLLAAHGAVSEACARAMCEGLAQRTHAELTLAITGIAGPDGGSEEKPVGLVYVAGRLGDRVQVIERRHGAVGRMAIRRRSVADALVLALRMLAGR